MQQFDTAVIILNWNGRQHVEACLRSVCNPDDTHAQIILVDNDSHDDSLTFVRAAFPQVRVIQNKKNFGFAEGNNIGIRDALDNPSIRFIALLNNDTEVSSGWLSALRHTMDGDQKNGIVASRMMNFFQRDTFDSAGDFLLPDAFKVVTRGTGEKDNGQYGQAGECFSARGGAVMYRREMLEDIRLDGDYFDRNFFAYIEDTDLSVRARLRGWRVVYAPTAVVYHKVSATVNSLSNTFRLFHSGRNRIFFAVKNLPTRLWLSAIRGNTDPTATTRSIVRTGWLYCRIGWGVLGALPRLIHQRKVITQRRTVPIHDILDWPQRFSISRHEPHTQK